MKTKRLATALCLLIVSALLLTSSSFAWFSMNTEVDVDGVEVEAYSDALFLEIATENVDSSFDVSAKFGNGNEKALLRLVTHKFIEQDTLYTITAPQIVSTTLRYATDIEYIPVSALDITDYNENLTYYELTVTGSNPATYDEVTNLTASDDVTGYYLKVDGFYKRGDSTTDTYSQDNYILADAELSGASSVAGFFKNPVFTLVGQAIQYAAYVKTTDTTYVDGTTTVYYENVGGSFTVVSSLSDGDDVSDYFVENPVKYYAKDNNNVYTEATTLADGDSVKGYYTVAAGSAEGTTALYDGISNYYKYESGAYTLVNNLELGTPLKGYYLVAATEIELDELGTTATQLFVENATKGDYFCVGSFDNTTDFTNYIYWGRTYSDALGQVQDENTLKVLKNSFDSYYYHDQIFLKSAENTNDASDLKVSSVQIGGRDNELSKAIRVLFVATSESGETATAIYNNNDRTITHHNGNNNLFDKLLGNKQETVTVDVYVYFDGTDTDAAYTVKDTEAGMLNGQSIKVEFTINEHPYEQ